MSGGERPINNDRSVINQSKLAGMSDTTGLSNTVTKIDPLPPLIFNSRGESHIHNGNLKNRSQQDKSKHPATLTDAGTLTDGIEPLSPPEPPPVISTPEKLIRHIFPHGIRRKTAKSSEDRLLNSLKIMKSKW
jgi:hypothetical protein